VFAKDKARVSRSTSRRWADRRGVGVLARPAARQRLRGGRAQHPQPPRHDTDRQPVQPREDTPIKPSFIVADLEAVRIAAANTGGHLRSLESAWRIRGFIVLDGTGEHVPAFKQPE
jgi:hypothetical protein